MECLPEVAHVHPRAENTDELILVAVDIPFHDVHARTHQTLECLYVQNWNKTQQEIISIWIRTADLFNKSMHSRKSFVHSLGSWDK